MSIEENEVPDDWKHAEVTPIFKKGSKIIPGNYRPVSLTSVLCKILESFIRDAIQHHMETLHLYSNCQHGFRKGKSCVTQLWKSWRTSSYIEDNTVLGVIYLDLKKAFDTVPNKDS